VIATCPDAAWWCSTRAPSFSRAWVWRADSDDRVERAGRTLRTRRIVDPPAIVPGKY
jgi:hypothetical protein